MAVSWHVRQSRREQKRKNQRAREALRPLRNAVNKALRDAGIAKAREGMNGRVSGMSLTYATGWLTESVWWMSGEQSGVTVKLEPKTRSVSTSKQRHAELDAEDNSVWRSIVVAIEGDARLRIVEHDDVNQKLRILPNDSLPAQ